MLHIKTSKKIEGGNFAGIWESVLSGTNYKVKDPIAGHT